ncbi:MAG: hypothetical protein K2K45_06965 [Muribaculaceae bacterium]|nr:hypothetical protein [Muribaculaceae bacterium]
MRIIVDTDTKRLTQDGISIHLEGMSMKVIREIGDDTIKSVIHESLHQAFRLDGYKDETAKEMANAICYGTQPSQSSSEGDCRFSVPPDPTI